MISQHFLARDHADQAPSARGRPDGDFFTGVAYIIMIIGKKIGFYEPIISLY